MTEKEILEGLNPEQIEAVAHDQHSLLLVAGAGTGKTTVITRRLAWLIFNKKAKPDEILALTFTEKAAEEMEERVDRLLPYGYVDLWISTFHSFGQRILEENALEIGLDPAFRIMTPVDAWQMMRKNIDRFELNYYKPLGSPTRFLKALIQHFSRLKDENVKPDEYFSLAERKLKKAQTDEQTEEAEKNLEVAKAYQLYEKIKIEEGYLDFGDLIIKTIELFNKRKSILEKYRRQFKYILVDEFQDTNWAQYKLLKLLAEPKNNITVTGDDDQCLPGDTLIKTRNGSKKISKIIKGEEVVTAVGRGYLAHSKVVKVFRKKKKARFLTFITKNGYKLQVTDNHKMFCFTPVRVYNKNFYYVYLMKKEKFGWRLGMTNDLAQRLKLERSADKILGIKACKTEEEARFYETLFSLKYGIPTSCFMERDGMMMKGEWVDRLYKEIDVGKNVQNLLSDLKISSESHHYSLGGVVRGNKVRIKINFEMCFRNYKSKYAKNYFLTNPLIRHRLHLETSHLPTIKKLKKVGFKLQKAKRGFRLRIENPDLGKIGFLAEKIKKITGGILECEFGIGRTNMMTQKALVMPASNVLPGLFLPIVTKNGIIYDQVLKVNEEYKIAIVYDLEVEKSHNFVANGVVVHNSLYQWRGAAYTNLIQFTKDYSDAKIVILKENYRNKQNILDLSYKFIQLNNPDRLEAKLSGRENTDLLEGLSKNLKAVRGKEGVIEHLHFKNQDEEAREVIKKIIDLKKKNRELAWSDFAILVRANDYATPFIEKLSQTEIPYQFVASRGLYRKPEIMDLISFLKLLDNYHESSAFYRFVSLPIFKMESLDLINLMHHSKKKNLSPFETFDEADKLAITPSAKKEAQKIVNILRRYTEIARNKSVGQVLYEFIEKEGLLRLWTNKADHETIEKIGNLKTFFKKIEEFTHLNEDKSVRNFVGQLDLELEAGEEGSLKNLLEEGPETVKIMTIHQAKGLEFSYVFIVNLVDKRFPSVERNDPIEVPNELIREILPEGDYHLQEERRIFYVAITRARDGLFFTSADDYGGTRKKKLSRFLNEIGFVKEEKKETKRSRLNLGISAIDKPDIVQGKNVEVLPKKFSFTQLVAFQNCPKQYKYAHILGVPGKPKFTFSFGHSIHRTLRDFYTIYQQTNNVPSLDKLLEIYEKNWLDDWYDSKEQERERKEIGRQSLINFYKKNENNFGQPKFIEKPFNLKIGDYTIKGVIDRVDVLEKRDGHDLVEIIDYKTGSAPKKKADLNPEQLLIYALAVREVLHEIPQKLTYYYFDDNQSFALDNFDEQLASVKERVLEKIEEIFKSDFAATPSPWKCKHCDFKEICEDRKL